MSAIVSPLVGRLRLPAPGRAVVLQPVQPNLISRIVRTEFPHPITNLAPRTFSAGWHQQVGEQNLRVAKPLEVSPSLARLG